MSALVISAARGWWAAPQLALTRSMETVISKASERVTAMANKPEDTTSAVFKDTNGVTLAYVFAHRSLDNQFHGVAYPGAVGRTLEHFSGITGNEDNNDGLNV
ncbi:hypothetical protein B0H13DRAFT_1850744 [Mycena leptocephala]|nr:hypothetical protein B0H13DRAFT_1850744 [Mycena leptocephala]